MSFNVEKIEHITVIHVQNEKLNYENAPELKSLIISLSKEDEFSPLIISLEKVHFADSSGLSALLLAQRTYRDSDRSFVICSIGDRVHKLLEVSQLNTVFQLADDLQQALALV